MSMALATCFLSLHIPGCAPPSYPSFLPVRIIHIQLKTSDWDLKLIPSAVAIVSDSWLLLAPAGRAAHLPSPAGSQSRAESVVARVAAECLAQLW